MIVWILLLVQNFSEVAAEFKEIFSGEESPSLTQEHLNDPEFIKLWFKVKLMPILPNVSIELLSCLSTKNFSCPVYHTMSVQSSWAETMFIKLDDVLFLMCLCCCRAHVVWRNWVSRWDMTLIPCTARTSTRTLSTPSWWIIACMVSILLWRDIHRSYKGMSYSHRY